MRAALFVEGRKMRRATAPRVAALAVVVFAPALSAAFLAAVRADTQGPMAAKIAPMVTDTGWAGLMGLVGEMLSIGMLLAAGVVTAWCFGREFTDGTFGSLFALPTSRREIAAAKALTLLHWGTDVVLGTVAFTLVLGLATGLGVPDAETWSAAGKTLVVAWLSLVLALPVGLVASALRGYLPGIAALLGIVIVTQVVTVTGVGAWFPYAAPGMWSGMGGVEVAATVLPIHLVLALPVGLAGVLATIWWWGRAQVV